MNTWLDYEREAIARRHAELRSLADPTCRTCKGAGTTTAYIAPSKSTSHACHCTGQADWQRPLTPSENAATLAP